MTGDVQKLPHRSKRVDTYSWVAFGAVIVFSAGMGTYRNLLGQSISSWFTTDEPNISGNISNSLAILSYRHTANERLRQLGRQSRLSLSLLKCGRAAEPQCAPNTVTLI